MSDRLVALPKRQFALLPAAQFLICLLGWQFLLGSLLCNSSPWPLLSLAPLFLVAQQLLIDHGLLRCNWF